MADKKVERNVRSSDQERPQTPTQKMAGALSDTGTVNVSEAGRDKAKTALLDRFRDREERYRREQSLADSSDKIPVRAAAPDSPTDGEEGSGAPSG